MRALPLSPDIMLTPAAMHFARVTSVWDAHIPKCAKLIEHVPPEKPTHVRYLHPTKGWRNVSYKRLGLA
jgi:hypothetical protein